MGFIINLLCLWTLLFYISSGGAPCSIDTVYQFGDSISDAGNLLIISPTIAAGKLPYGETYPGFPTGRWCDGRTLPDYTGKDSVNKTMQIVISLGLYDSLTLAAELFGLRLLEPSLKPNASFESGINFAIAGATAINTSTLLAYGIETLSIPSLSDQINSFKTYLGSLCSTKSECRNKLRNSLFYLGSFGANDINFGLLSNKTTEQIEALIPLIVEAIVNGVKELISLGASKIIVPGLFPIGCIPRAADFNTSLINIYGCSEVVNEGAIYLNNLLQHALKMPSLTSPDVKVTYLDNYNTFEHFLMHAPLYGFNVSTVVHQCCGTGDYNVSSPRFCSGPGVPVCPNPNHYINWDGYHLTQEANAYFFKLLSPTILLAAECIM